MSEPRVRRLGVAVAVVLILLVPRASAGPAAPTIGEVYVQKSKQVPSGEQVSAKVGCPKGREVLSGGVVVSGTDIRVNVASNGPADGADADRKLDDAWKGAINNGSPFGETMVVYAQCAAKADSPYIKHFTESFGVNPGAAGLPKIFCDAPMVVTGGGVLVSGGGMKAPLRGTMPRDESAEDPQDTHRDDSWVAFVDNDSSKKIRLTFTGICADPNALGALGGAVISSEATGGAAGMTQGFGAVNCPADHIALGGGVGEASILGDLVTVASIRPDRPDTYTTGWSGFLNNHSAGATSFKVAALCIDPFL
jgi:hypothetical protein